VPTPASKNPDTREGRQLPKPLARSDLKPVREAPAWSGDGSGFVSLPVTAIFEETGDLRTVRLARPMGFDFQAGQSLTVAIKIDGEWATERYPISSAPESFGYLEISVRRNGRSSGVLHSAVGVGSLLAVAPLAKADGTEGAPASPAPLALEVVRQADDRQEPRADGIGATSPSGQEVAFPRKEQVREILRFARGEMMLHWSIAIPFLICFATGVSMKLFYNLHDDSLLRAVLSFLHRVAGGCLAVFPLLAIARNWRDYKVHIYNVKVGFSWTIDDLKWLFLIGPSTVSRRVVLPEQRKFNAAERLNFMMVMVTYPLFVGTGLVLWTRGADHFLPWIVHISMSLVAPLLMFGHIYMAVVNPGTRVGLSGMFTGRVDREWAKHHYRAWYREHFEDDGTPRP
jgi:formate dehydrogenase subunit gamma